MSERNAKFYVNGTSALDMGFQPARSNQARIIAFPQKRVMSLERCKIDERQLVPASSLSKIVDIRGKLRTVLESSEMYCSLKYESFNGCPYMRLTKKNLALLSAGSAAIAIISLMFGA